MVEFDVGGDAEYLIIFPVYVKFSMYIGDCFLQFVVWVHSVCIPQLNLHASDTLLSEMEEEFLSSEN